MSDSRFVKIETVLESQIPFFLSSESPLFQEFLKQYYVSQNHTTGVIDISNSLNQYKNIQTYTKDIFYTESDENQCFLTERIYSYDAEIQVNSTFGFPDHYGLIQIENEIITYTDKTETAFIGCARGFSGITEISDTPDSSGLVFQTTDSTEHPAKAKVQNLNLIFYEKLFEKFKAQYLPDFEKRVFSENIDLDLILSRARDFYLSKGSDTSYKILFEILYHDEISIFKPQEYIIRSSTNNSLVTKNILVELISGSFHPKDLIGLTIFQDISNTATASASIYNVEYRPTDELNLFEISLDSDSFVYNFVPTKKTSIVEKVSDGFLVDSTVGFPNSGTLYAKLKENNSTNNYVTLGYNQKSITKFSDITDITESEYSLIQTADDLIEDRLAKVFLPDGTTLQFRILNVLGTFDYSNTNTSRVNDVITISSFGENYSNQSEYNSWIYNYSTYHRVKSYDTFGFVRFYTPIHFLVNEEIILVSNSGITTTSKVLSVLESDRIQVAMNNITSIKTVRKIVSKSPLNNAEPSYIQNAYRDIDSQSLIISSSGLPYFNGPIKLNNYSFNLVGVGSVFSTQNTITNQIIKHRLYSGSQIFLNSNYVGISTGQYVIKKITDTTVSLYKSTGNLCLSYSHPESTPPINLNNSTFTSLIGVATILEYENSEKGFANQLLLKKFNVQRTLEENKITSSGQINSIEDAYFAFKS